MVRPSSWSDYKYSLCKTGNMKNSILVASICTILMLGDPVFGYGIDCSFPILNQTIRQDCGGLPDKSLTYRDYMDSCELIYSKEECQSEEDARLNRNRIQPRSMVNYTVEGFRKVRAPPSLQKLLLDFWENNQDDAEDEAWGRGDISTNHWKYPTKMIDIHDEEYIGGGEDLANAVWDVAKTEVEGWTGMKVRPSSVYGIRVYPRGSILSPHVDRLPLVSSCIVNVAQDVDEPWPLEVYDRNDQAVNVTMEPFDMVFYESHSLLHGRPFPLNGNYFANIFIHFETYGERTDGSDAHTHHDSSLPPYVLPDTPAAEEYMEDNPNGWSKILSEKDFKMLYDLVAQGEIDELRKLLDQDPNLVHVSVDEEQWQLLHEAVAEEQLNIVKLLISRGADINALTEEGLSPHNIAIDAFGNEHLITAFLEENGASTSELGWEDESFDDQDDPDSEEQENDEVGVDL